MLAYTYSLPSIGVRALICRFQLVCARWGISPACIVMLLSMGVRALGCITCLHRVTAFHWRACVEAYRLLASTSRFPLTCARLDVLPACIYILTAFPLVCVRAFGRIPYLCLLAPFHWHVCVGRFACTCSPFLICVRTLVKLPACVYLIVFVFHPHASDKPPASFYHNKKDQRVDALPLSHLQ